MTRALTLSSIASLTLLLGACADGGGALTASGHVTVDAGAYMTGFPFSDNTRLEDPASAATPIISGFCEIRRDRTTPDGWAVTVDIQRSMVEDNGLASISIIHRNDIATADGMIALSLGSTSFSSRQDGTCLVELTHAIPNGGMAGFLGTCAVEDTDGNTATLAIDLSLDGCDVIED